MKPICCILLAALCLVAGEGRAAPEEKQTFPAPPREAPDAGSAPAREAPDAGSAPAGETGSPAEDSDWDRLDPELAFALTAGQAEKGDAAAMLRLGGLYEQGIAVPRNYSKAREWYQKAAAAGLAEGYYNLGLCYEIGMGTEANLEQAAANFEKAAALGLPHALYKLGLWSRTGTGVPQNTAKALEYLTLAADGGHIYAANDLGVLYAGNALGRKPNPGLALNLFLKAAEQGDAEAMKNIAVLFKGGLNGKPNPVKALKWYIIARDSGYSSRDLAAVMDGLRAGMTPGQIAAAETEAGEWIKLPRTQIPGGKAPSESPD
ncbi:MAG: sel1 repeat family protein [Desulfovibrio sp.]|jgi:TPR repeat protein|nr:sel1 repeat family protein [Desulfovibrio sp.]